MDTHLLSTTPQEGRADDFRQHLLGARDDTNFHLHCARYLETHEEKRACEVFGDHHEEAGTYRHFAAAIAAYTLPGMRLFHDGQLQVSSGGRTSLRNWENG